MNYPFFLARRLSLGSGCRHWSPSVVVAVIAIAISVAVMIASISIVLGFKKEIRDKVVGFNSHITLSRMPSTPDDDNLITLTPFLKDVLDSFPFIKEYTYQASIPAILKTDGDFKGVYMRGLSGPENINYVEKNLEVGEVPDYSLKDNENNIVISRKAANELRLDTGMRIDTYFISDELRVRRLKISGIFNTHFDQYDDVIIFGSMPLVARLGDLPDSTGTYISIYTDSFDNIADYSSLIQQHFNQAVASGMTNSFYRTDNVLSQGRGFFGWLALLDTNVIVIIILMTIVGCVTLISGMLIIILERKRFIGLMRALGATSSKIRTVFIYMALKIALIGLLFGDCVISVVLYLQDKYHFIKLDADAYYIDFVPVYLSGWIVFSLNIATLFIIYLVLVLPSRFVGKISPAESILKSE